jgi:hypothetical protein
MRKSVSMGLVAGVLGMGMASAEIKVSDALSLSGFLDMSVTSNFPDGGDPTLNAGFDQFELDFSYTFSDALKAQVDLNYEAWNNTSDTAATADAPGMTLEQAFLTYSKGGLSLYAGKFLSASGFEAAEPTGLYQYSVSETLVYGGYQNGVAASFAISPMISLYGAVVGSVWDGMDTDLSEPGYEAQVSLMPMEGITVKAGYFGTDVGAYTQSLINVWGMYSAGPLTAAAEVNVVSNWTAEDDNGLGYLVMANFKLSDKLGITGRYSALDTDAGGLSNEVTVSPGYAISDSWFVLAEAKYMLELKETRLAAESILTF